MATSASLVPIPVGCHCRVRVSGFPIDLDDKALAAPRNTVGGQVDFPKLLHPTLWETR